MATGLRYKGPKQLNDKDLVTYEDLKRIGGTWKQNATKAITNATPTKMQFQTQVDNTGITVTSNQDFQVPTTGLYAMSFQCRIPSNQNFYGMIGLSTGQDNQNDYVIQSGNTNQDVCAAITMPLAASTTVSCYVYINASVTTDSGRWARFSIYRVAE